MKTKKLRIIIATAVAAISVSAVAGPIAPNASAAAPKTVHAGSTGNKQLDDICRQMADLINTEITEGWNAETSGDFGSANAWWNQASDHIARAQAAGCVMAMRVPRPTRFTGVFAGVQRGSYTPMARTAPGGTGSGTKSPSGGQVVMAKKISGTAGGGKWSQSQCDDIARWVNDALKKSADAAANGDADLAAGWRQNANDLLAAGRAGGCSFTAALRAQQIQPVGGATASKG